jgi:hypothetical protein
LNKKNEKYEGKKWKTCCSFFDSIVKKIIEKTSFMTENEKCRKVEEFLDEMQIMYSDQIQQIHSHSS